MKRETTVGMDGADAQLEVTAAQPACHGPHVTGPPARELISGDIEFARADMPLLVRILAALQCQTSTGGALA